MEQIMQQMQKIGISPEHYQDVQGIHAYLKDHRINQLFNVSQTSLRVLIAQDSLS